METKLTLQDCYKYPKAPLINELKLKCENLTELIKLCAFDSCNIERILTEGNFKLCLRSIEQLTDEERKHIMKLSLNPLRFPVLAFGTLDFFEDDKNVFDYLRSINIDIDGMLNNGKAVKDE
jgi:hypothetical protein